MTIKILHRDSLKFGMLTGFIAPLIGVLFFYLIKFSRSITMLGFFRIMFQNKSVLTAVSSISLLINVAVFTFYINRKLDKTGKGIFLLTVLYILFVLIYKLF